LGRKDKVKKIGGGFSIPEKVASIVPCGKGEREEKDPGAGRGEPSTFSEKGKGGCRPRRGKPGFPLAVISCTRQTEKEGFRSLISFLQGEKWGNPFSRNKEKGERGKEPGERRAIILKRRVRCRCLKKILLPAR